MSVGFSFYDLFVSFIFNKADAIHTASFSRRRVYLPFEVDTHGWPGLTLTLLTLATASRVSIRLAVCIDTFF